MLRNSCKGCEYSQKCELVKMTKEERKRREEIEEEIKKYIGGNKMILTGDNITEMNTRVECEDKENWEFNAPHHFIIRNIHNGEIIQTINFQKGPIKENGVNGGSNEDYINMVIKRLESFQDSEWSCEENAEAIKHFQNGLLALRKRTNKRIARNVLGTSEK